MLKKQFNQYCKNFMKVLGDNIDEELRNIGKILDTEIVKKIKEKSPIASNSGLVKSNRIKVKNHVMTLRSTKEYSMVYNYGRKPGTGVSIEGQVSMRKWVMRGIRRGILTPPSVSGKGKSYSKAVDSIVYLICRKIKKFGIEGKFAYTDALNENESKIMDRITKAINKSSGMVV